MQGGVFYRLGAIYVPYLLVWIHVHFHFFNVFISAVVLTYKEIHVMLL